MGSFIRCILAGVGSLLMCVSAQADSQFAGFYGQLSTGFENNQISSIQPSWTNTTADNWYGTGSASTQNFQSMPLVIGVGYFAELEKNFMFGIGVDYSPLAESTGNFSHTSTRVDGNVFAFNNMSYQVSNRVNVYIMPSYAIDSDKLGYLKLGYSTQTLKYQQDPDLTSAGLTSGFSSSSSLNGFLVGFGYKQIVVDGLYGFAEANYIAYAKSTINGSGSASGQNIDMSASQSASSYNFLFGLGYKF